MKRLVIVDGVRTPFCKAGTELARLDAVELGRTAVTNQTVRSVFIIAPDKKIKLYITYPASTGRNFHEVLRVVDSLQLTANYSVATPANWETGQDVIVVPAVSTEDAIKKFPKGVNVVKPYLRYTPQPNI